MIRALGIAAFWTWSMPWTLVGLALALASRPGWRGLRPSPELPALEVHARGGLGAWGFRRFGFAGITLGAVIIYRDPAPGPRLRRHELRHAVQAAILGPLYVPIYGMLWAAAGFKYEANLLEEDARNVEGD